MTNPELHKELSMTVYSIHENCGRSIELTQIEVKTDAEREEISRSAELIRARLWADVCRGISLAEDVEAAFGLTDENSMILAKIVQIHDGMIAEGDGHV